MTRLLVTVAAVLLLATVPAGAAVLRVSTTGSDATGDGSAVAPFATIGRALAAASPGDEVVVAPGLYSGRVRLDGSFLPGVIVRSEVPYQARLRHDSTVVTCFTGQGITLEGFDIAHSGPGAGALVVQVQDLIGPEPGGADRVSRIVIRDCVIHDSYDNDLLKINNGASDVLVEGCVFYDQAGSDEHVDVNSVTDVILQDNVFFNDFAGSGRADGSDTSSFVVVKDSNGTADTNLGAERITIRRNVFLNWQGSTGSNFVLCGEDGNPYFEARDVLVENNLMIGNSPSVMRAAVGVKGCQGVTFRSNTVTGDLPSLAHAFRLNTEGANPPNDGITFRNNAWSDPTGTMGAEDPSRPTDFCDAPPGQTAGWIIDQNAYWNGGAPIPRDAAEAIEWVDDVRAVVGDPLLPDPSGVVVPRWVPALGRFADGSLRIRDAFVRLVELARPAGGSPLVDAADPAAAPARDILGTARPQGPAADIGALEVPLAVAEPPEVDVRVGAGASVGWGAVGDALRYDTYRGTIPLASLASRAPGAAAYDHACFERGDALGDGALASTDPSSPPAGMRAFYYLVAAVGASGRADVGDASRDLDPASGGDQRERPVPAPCP